MKKTENNCKEMRSSLGPLLPLFHALPVLWSFSFSLIKTTKVAFKGSLDYLDLVAKLRDCGKTVSTELPEEISRIVVC